MKLISVAAMRDLEQRANAAGFTFMAMMQTAGERIALYVDQKHRRGVQPYALGLIGGGNNGGDTLIALSLLQSRGWNTRAILARDRKPHDVLLQEYCRSGGAVVDAAKMNELQHLEGIVLDGIYGTGFRSPLPEPIQNLLSDVSESLPGFAWIAVDCPSGMDCESGEVSRGTVKAAETVCLEAVKRGMLTYSAFPYLGELITVDLGIARSLGRAGEPGDMVITDELVRMLLPKREAFSHKGSYGKALVIGGSANYPGAPVLAGRGAYAVGTGLVQVAVPASVYPTGVTSCPELTWVLLEDAGGCISEIAAETVILYWMGCDSAVLGPGLGRHDSTRRFVFNLLLRENLAQGEVAGFHGVARRQKTKYRDSGRPPLVIDADGLTLLGEDSAWFEKSNLTAVLTPHPGEMAHLTGLSVEEVQSDRMEVARRFALQWGQTVVLKGPLTVVAGTEGHIAVLPVATSSLAKAGTGDVLAGMIAGFLAQGLSTWEAALVGAWMHAQAGLATRKIVGCDESVLAGDVIRAIPEVYKLIE